MGSMALGPRAGARLILALGALALASAFQGYTLAHSSMARVSHAMAPQTRGTLRAAILLRRARVDVRRGVLAIRSQESSPRENKRGGGSATDLPTKAAVWASWLAYNYVIFFSNYPCGATGTGDLCGVGLPTIKEAIDLSINFWFVTPLVLPSVAPVIHPALEGLFNFVIAFGALFVGFLSDGKGQKYAMLPFMVGTAFLTNVFYLPYLGVRRQFKDAAAAVEAGEGADVPEQQIAVAESKGLPIAMLAVFAASVAWGAFGRGGGDFGDIATRWTTLVDMALHTDRLAHSFMVDSLVFWGFQGWLVPDDMRRRGWDNKGVEAVARAIPFFGLAYYLLARPPLPENREN